ncbi:MAG: hypothetical protein R6T83_07860, partial [Salinibacter sp.]
MTASSNATKSHRRAVLTGRIVFADHHASVVWIAVGGVGIAETHHSPTTLRYPYLITLARAVSRVPRASR